MWYTRKGDDGTTGLPGGRRVPKTDPTIETLGALDELNSLIGVCRANSTLKNPLVSNEALAQLQQQLFVVQAQIAGLRSGKDTPAITDEHVNHLEGIVAAVEKEHPPITSFIVPGTTVLSGLLDYARAVSRRVERRASAIEGVPKETARYLNRLSSALYALARRAAQCEEGEEQVPHYN